MDILSTNIFASDACETAADVAFDVPRAEEGAMRCAELLRNAGLRRPGSA